MATGDRDDPYRGFNFRIEITGTTPAVAAFREASGLTASVDPVEYRNGNSPDLHVKKLFGLRKYTNVILKRGITTNNELWVWYRQIVNGIADRRNGAVVMLDEVGADVHGLRWNFYEAWPCKLDWPALNATTNEVAVETLEMCVEKIELV
jgi:phage tail-like protein